MYEAFFNLREKPFALNPDPEYLYPSRRHRAALTMLEYGLTGQAGFVVLTGEVGSGKTTLIRHFLRQAKDEATIGVITNTHESLGDLMRWIALAFGLDAGKKEKVELYADFMRFVQDTYRNGSRVILVVDEAQNMSIETLEELRMLSNVNVEKDMMLQTVLVGQPELLDKLRRPELAQFAQRVAIDYHLTRLSYPETRAYIRHRLQVAGGSADLFNIEAIGGVYYFSNGIPRVINTLCDSALVYAFADEKHQVDVATILGVAADRRSGLMRSIGEQYKDINMLSLQAALQRFASYEKNTQSGQPETSEAANDTPKEPVKERISTGKIDAVDDQVEDQTPSLSSFQEVAASGKSGSVLEPHQEHLSVWNTRSFQFSNAEKTPSSNTTGSAEPHPTPRKVMPSMSESASQRPTQPETSETVKPLFVGKPIIAPPRLEPTRTLHRRRWWRFSL